MIIQSPASRESQNKNEQTYSVKLHGKHSTRDVERAHRNQCMANRQKSAAGGLSHGNHRHANHDGYNPHVLGHGQICFKDPGDGNLG